MRVSSRATLIIRSDHPLNFDKSTSFTMSLAEGLVARMIRTQKPLRSIDHSLAFSRYRTHAEAFKAVGYKLGKAGLILSYVQDKRGLPLLDVAMASFAWDADKSGFVPIFIEVGTHSIGLYAYPYVLSSHAVARIIFRLAVTGYDQVSICNEILNLASSFTTNILECDFDDNTLVSTERGVGVVVKDKDRSIPVVTTWLSENIMRPEQFDAAVRAHKAAPLVGLAELENKTLQELVYHGPEETKAVYQYYLDHGGTLNLAEFIKSPELYIDNSEAVYGSVKLNSKLVSLIG
jgi:hypothetical protein